MIAACYLAAEGFSDQLGTELRRGGARVAGWHGRLALSPDPPLHAAWALDTWTAPQVVPAPSVKAAADVLRAMQRNWGGYAPVHVRRSTLIAARLPPVKAAKLAFPALPPASHLGAWTLLEPNVLLASPTKSSPFVNGEIGFIEDRAGPPSRAYLKLWEAITRLGTIPAAGQTALDLGAAPGGWTWVLARLGVRVTGVDKAPPDPAVAAMPGVAWRMESAFALDPRAEPPVDWLVCDVVAYPVRTLRLVTDWIAAGAARRVIATVKFQGETDFAAADAFAAIPGGRLMHLAHNRHELTFVWPSPSLASVDVRPAGGSV